MMTPPHQNHLITNQVVEMCNLLPNNLGNDFFSINNPVEVQAFQHRMSIENALVLLDSDRKDENIDNLLKQSMMTKIK